MDVYIQHASSHMQKVLGVLHQDLATLRTGRATPSLIDNVVIAVYGGTTKMKIMELATITAPDSQTIVISPFDNSILDEIQKGIQEANLGFNPGNDGRVIRINIPPLSQERRQELIHVMKQKLENGRIMIRQGRQDAMTSIKRDETLSEDDKKRMEKEIQRVTDEFMGKIDSLGEIKEKELMQI
jgi:ribosome recycling factor